MEALKFREMPYERPDGEALKTSMRTLTEKLRAAGSYDAAKAVFLEKETPVSYTHLTLPTSDLGVDEGDARLAVPRGL